MTGPQLPSGFTVAVPVEPSGKVTVTVDPGSPSPVTDSVPSSLGVAVTSVGASGAFMSVKVSVVSPETLPASSSWLAVTSPEVCGAVEVTGPQLPSGFTVAVPVEPSGKVTVTVDPGSPSPVTDSVPSSLGVAVTPVGSSGAVVSVYRIVSGPSTLPWESVCRTDTSPVVWGVVDVTE